MTDNFVNVAFPLPLRQTFTYGVPDALIENAKPGARVIAPFGARRLTGFIVEGGVTPEIHEIKDVLDVLDGVPLISEEVLSLCEWISEYYLCSLGEALKTTVPASFLSASKITVEATVADAEQHAWTLESRAPRQAQILRYLAKSGRLSINHLKRRIGTGSLFSSINQLADKGLVRMEQRLGRSARERFRKYVRIAENIDAQDVIAALRATAPKQAECLSFLQANPGAMIQTDLVRDRNISLSVLRALEKKKLVEIFEKRVMRDFYDSAPVQKTQPLVLNQEQRAAVDRIVSALAVQAFQSFLLFGVTGSGKTQVYIEAIYRVLEKGQDAIVLVPEIALTPQTVQRFRAHFKERVAVLHSAMSEGERYDSWRRLHSGEAKVAIGPRSAVFAPLKNLGLIVVDEEHEGSYKQTDSAPRYHARDVAVLRAKQANAVVLLGSATPSTETYYNALRGKYELLELRQRVNEVPMPPVTIVDMLKERRLSGQRGMLVLSRLLDKKLESRLQRREQSILLLNRRGFSSYLKCMTCGHVETCEQCDITLTYHLQGRRLRCHYCGSSKKAPHLCALCGGEAVQFRGLGTQQVEEALHERFPEARIVRMDQDTTSRKWAHDRILRQFGEGKYDILLGTQMVAKGLDFHRVTLVGVINADIGMLLPDFRASERTFQLLTQVAGRAGRSDLPGEVVIQTFAPDNVCIECTRRHDFLNFFNTEVNARKALRYTPFGKLVYILFKGKNSNQVMAAARYFGELLKPGSTSFRILGPTAAPIAKIQNKFRWQILLKGIREKDPAGKQMRAAVLQTLDAFKKERRYNAVQVSVDVDPMSIV